ncbi:tetracycline resistance protein from transposon [Plectosphaerella plurivora]|uniref:Tetracycline resistance protein from transposon n=1 Tax=Plectosphaerella plurivora TaxID=936078 RepID=A0A9P8V0B2_9PEZI|nr:tetracycline resistance protein from transposon [Plectosphaerella plurivora]
MSTPKIAVIGAGPAGCMLARLLHLAEIDVTIFESEASPTFRSQGGTLDLHTDTGLLAMKEAKLWDEFKKHARYDGQYIAWVDRHNEQVMVMGVDSHRNDVQERPEIDRSRLREILAESLPEGTVKWGHKLKSVEADNTLVFEHTTVSGFDLVVGADGTWSKVRKAVTSVEPKFTGIGLYELNIPDGEKTAPDVYKLVNRGSVFAHAEGKRLSIQQMGDGSLCIYTSELRDDKDWMAKEKCGYDSGDLVAVREALHKEYHDWDDIFQQVFDKAAGTPKPRSLFMLPVGWRWEHKRGVTIIGDAAHCMTPFAGEGVNVALMDALELSRAIISARDAGFSEGVLEEKVEAFEKGMFPRMEKLTNDYLRTPGVPQSIMARVMTRHVKCCQATMRRACWGLEPIDDVRV